MKNNKEPTQCYKKTQKPPNIVLKKLLKKSTAQTTKTNQAHLAQQPAINRENTKPLK